MISRTVEAVIVVLDVVRGYLQVAEGLTDMSVQRARHVADALMSRSSDAAERSSEQIGALAEDLVKQSQNNRDILIGLIRTEVDRTVGRMGFVREEELAAVRSHVQRLEAQLRSLQAGAAGAGTTAARSAGGAAVRTLSGAAGMASRVVPAKRAEDSPVEAILADPAPAAEPAATAEGTTAKTTATKTTATKTATKTTAAKKTTATKTTAAKTATKTTAAKKTAAKKTTAAKKATAAKKSTATKTTAAAKKATVAEKASTAAPAARKTAARRPATKKAAAAKTTAADAPAGDV